MSVASKIFAVLDLFDGPHTSLRLADVAERADLPVPTAWRLLRELVAWGGLERQADGSYRIGRRLWTIGTISPCERRIRDAGRPHLQELLAATGHRARSAILDRHQALVLDLAGHNELDKVGERLPLHATSVGKILLAHAAPTVLEDLAGHGLPRLTPRTVNAPGLLGRELAEVRRSGIAVEHQEHRLGLASIAAPVRDASGAVVAAIGLVTPSHVNPLRFADRVQRAAAAMSQDLARQN